MNNRRRQRKRQLLKNFDGVRLTKMERWYLYKTLAKYIADGLRQFLAEEIHSLPYSKEYVEKSEENGEYAYTVLTMKEWQHIIAELIWTFDNIANNEEGPLSEWKNEQYRLRETKFESQGLSMQESFLKGLAFSIPNPPDEILEQEKRYTERIENGLELFVRYFRDLVD